jgi:hypothetical protein
MAEQDGRSPWFPFPRLFLSGATKRAHDGILAERADFVQVMMTLIFKTQNPCKH